MSNTSLNSKLAAEFIGTFFLALTICTAAVHGSAGEYAPFAIAATLMVMIYAVGHISGAHFNPAVTVAVWIRGACDKNDVATIHWNSAIGGGPHAAFVSQELLFSETSVASIQMDTTNAISAEFLYTFALVYVILNVATAEATEGNSYYGARLHSWFLQAH